MLKRIISALILSLFISAQTLAFSLPLPTADEEVVLAAQEPIRVSIDAKSSSELGKSLIFDASDSVSVAADAELSYEWFFGDGNRQQGVEVVHSYAESGEYEVTLVVRDNFENQVTKIHDLFIYESSFVLISDVESKKNRITSFTESAREENVFVSLITSYTSQSEFLAEEDLKQVIAENISDINSSNLVVIWTKGSSGLTVLSQIQQLLTNKNFFADKSIVFISDEHFGSLSNIARGVYKSISPYQIILTRPEAVSALLEVSTPFEFLDLLDARGVQSELIDSNLSIAPWNLMSHFVNLMIERGVPTNTLRLILMLPIIVTIVAFMKQVVGLATLGVYTPSILALSFIALDLSYGLLFLFAILFMGTISRLFLRRYRLLYIPRMAIVLTFVSLTILFLMFLGAILSTMVEKFVSIQSGKGLRKALTLVGEAVLVAIICFFVAEWGFLKVFVLGHPEVIFLFLLANIALARFSGLRLLEYVRFREIIRHAEE